MPGSRPKSATVDCNATKQTSEQRKPNYIIEHARVGLFMLEIMTADRNEYDFAQACAASGVRASPIRTSAKHATRLTEATESLATTVEKRARY